MPHRITQCYLPPGRGDIPALTPAEAGTRLSDPGGMQGQFDLVGLLHTEMVYPPEDGHQSRARRALTSFMWRTPLTTTPRRQPYKQCLLFTLNLFYNECWSSSLPAWTFSQQAVSVTRMRVVNRYIHRKKRSAVSYLVVFGTVSV